MEVRGAISYIQLNRATAKTANESLGKKQRGERAGQLRHRQTVFQFKRALKPGGARSSVHCGAIRALPETAVPIRIAQQPTATDISTTRSVRSIAATEVQ